jgi:hypothetical protein
MMDASTIVNGIESGWRSFLEHQRQSPSKRNTVYASGYSDCVRRLVLEMTDGDKQPAWDAEVLGKFRRGQDRERDLIADLKRIGRDCIPAFEVIGEQERFVLKDHKGRDAISGKVDARLQFSRDVKAPLEVKGWHPNMVDRIDCFADLFNSPWTKKGAYQLLAYLLGSGEPLGFMLLDKSGLPKLIPVELEPNLDKIEDFLQKAELAHDHKDAGTFPDFIEDPDECKRCWCFGNICNPPMDFGEGAVVLDAEFEATLLRREELIQAHKEYESLDKEVKDQCRGIEEAVCGQFLLLGEWQTRKKLDIPKEIKAQYERVDPHGAFVLKITKL